MLTPQKKNQSTLQESALQTLDTGERLGNKSWYPRRGMPLGATFFLRKDFPWLTNYLDLPQLSTTLSPGIGGTVSWGGRVAAKIAQVISRTRRLPHWHMEDGFLRSVSLGKAKSVPLSIVLDDLALSTDAKRPSRLEYLIAEATGKDEEAGARVRDAIVQGRLSKYNHLPHRPPSLPSSPGRKRLLLIDQVKGDVSVPFSLGSSVSFERMLNDALASRAQCVIRTHPDVIAGYRKGYLTELASRHSNVILSAEPVSADAMIAACDEVWTVASQFGFDALLRGKPVRCYAAPFYAGWGLTEDVMDDSAKATLASRRKPSRSIDHLASAAFLAYPIYRDPRTWREIDFFGAVDLILQSRTDDEL